MWYCVQSRVRSWFSLLHLTMAQKGGWMAQLLTFQGAWEGGRQTGTSWSRDPHWVTAYLWSWKLKLFFGVNCPRHKASWPQIPFPRAWASLSVWPLSAASATQAWKRLQWISHWPTLRPHHCTGSGPCLLSGCRNLIFSGHGQSKRAGHLVRKLTRNGVCSISKKSITGLHCFFKKTSRKYVFRSYKNC